MVPKSENPRHFTGIGTDYLNCDNPYCYMSGWIQFHPYILHLFFFLRCGFNLKNSPTFKNKTLSVPGLAYKNAFDEDKVKLACLIIQGFFLMVN